MTSISEFTSDQYMAWSVMGAMTITSALFYIQTYYYQFWKDETRASMNFYSFHGIAEWISIVTLLLQWVPAAIVWIFGTLDVWTMVAFYVTWIGWAKLLYTFRFLVLTVLRTLSFVMDHHTSTWAANGWETDYKISIEHKMDFFQYTIEFLGFATIFGNWSQIDSITNP